MLKSFFIFFLFTSSVHAGPATFDIQALKTRFSTPVPNDGPNCYNTTLLALGYVSELMYSSGKELNFYLKNFCQEVSTTVETAPNGIVLTYRFADGTLSHAASLLGKGWVFEKNNYRGTSYAEGRGYTYPGYYLIQPYSKSIYRDYFSIYQTAFYQCASADEVHAALAEIRNRPWALRYEEMRAVLSDAVQSKSLEELSVFMTDTGFLYLVELQEMLKIRTKSAFEKEYLFVIGQSIYGQILYATESTQNLCPSCKSHDVEPLNIELTKAAEILNRYKPKKLAPVAQ